MPRLGKKPEPEYAALIGDVVGSRRLLEGRAQLQRQLAARLADLNGSLSQEALAARLTITGGDGIQGLFRRPAAVVQVVSRLSDEIHPVGIVFGLGYGTLSTDLEPDVGFVDGPCFHRARSALESATRAGGWLAADGFGAPADEAITALFRLMHEVRSRWTPTQLRYARAARTMRQNEVAMKYGVAASTVSESLAAAGFSAVLAGEAAAAAVLAQFGAPGEVRSDSVIAPHQRRRAALQA